MWLTFDNESECSKKWTKKIPVIEKNKVRLIMYERDGVENMFISEKKAHSSWEKRTAFIDCTYVKHKCAG